MTALTLRAVNLAIAHLGDITLYKGDGYFYFIGDNVNPSAGVYVYRLGELSMEEWVEEAAARMQTIEDYEVDCELAAEAAANRQLSYTA
jgi:hypothetical protein